MSTASRTLVSLSSIALLWALAPPGSADAAGGRPESAARNGVDAARPTAPAASATELLQCLLGPDVAVSNVVLTAPPHATGIFAGKLGVLGFDQGLILSSGDVTTLNGPNVGDSTSTDNLTAGDPDLDALIPNFVTFDAVVLEFDFTCSAAQDVVFQYVFGSEEYNEYVDSPFNDVFGFFLNGSNIAVAPVGCSGAGTPVSINNVNCGNPYVGAGPNCNCFRNNDLTDGGGAIDTELDGLTQVFFAAGAILSGTNHIKIALADAGDPVLDSDVMIRCQSFTCGAPPVTGACCLPGGPCVTLTGGDCTANGGTYHGDGTSCGTDPCGGSSGACCLPSTACETESPDSCAAQGGSYQGDASICQPNPCGAPVGACCFGAIGCEVRDVFSCFGYFVGAGTSCDLNTCTNVTGACCADAAICEEQTLDHCGDTFLGYGTVCAPNPCEEIVGACCHDNGSCAVTLQVDCGDFYLGNRTVCDPNPCGGVTIDIFRDDFELGSWSLWSNHVP